MRLVRPAVCLALTGALIGAGVADAAIKKPKPVCNLITDAAGDATATTLVTAGPNDAALDVLSADIAADAKTITAVIRIAKVSETAQTAPTGYHVVFNFTAPGAANPLYMQYFSGNAALKSGFDYGFDDPTQGLTSLGDGFGVIDLAKNEIRISAPLNGFDAQGGVKKNNKLSGLSVQGTRDLVVLLPYSDIASSDKVYAVGALSCVRPGK